MSFRYKQELVNDKSKVTSIDTQTLVYRNPMDGRSSPRRAWGFCLYNLDRCHHSLDIIEKYSKPGEYTEKILYLHVDKIICSANALEKMSIIAFSFKMFYFSVKGAHLIFIEALWNYVCSIHIVGKYPMPMSKLLKGSWRLKVDIWHDLFTDMYNDFLNDIPRLKCPWSKSWLSLMPVMRIVSTLLTTWRGDYIMSPFCQEFQKCLYFPLVSKLTGSKLIKKAAI